MQYRSPYISTLSNLAISAASQGSAVTQIPDCDGDQCVSPHGENLGSECLDIDPDRVDVRVFIPGSGNTTAPHCTISVGSDQINSSNCSAEASLDCPDTWLFSCTDQGTLAPDFSCPDNVGIQCEDFNAVPCDNDIT